MLTIERASTMSGIGHAASDIMTNRTESTMSLYEWVWPTNQHPGQHSDRWPLMHPIAYEMISADLWRMGGHRIGTAGYALSLNMSPGGLLILMGREPSIDQVMRVSIPSPVQGVSTPTLADVRWTRKVPLIGGEAHAVFFVGLRFML